MIKSLHVTLALTRGSREQLGGGWEQLDHRGPEPVGDGSGHRDVDTFALLDGEEGVIARVH